MKDGSSKCLGNLVKKRESRGRVKYRVSAGGQFLNSVLRDGEDVTVQDSSKIGFVVVFVVFTLPLSFRINHTIKFTHLLPPTLR